MDITLEIDGVPFRFFSDDHVNPKKKGFWRRNDADQLFAPDELEPVMFRFIVEAPIQEEDSLEIYFIGFNSLEEPVCEWRYGRVAILSQLLRDLPEAVEQKSAQIGIPRKNDGDEDIGSKTGST